MIKFQPKNDKLLVRRSAEIVRTAGGILVPDVAKDQALRGTVLAVSSKYFDDFPTTFAVGDIVCFGRYSGVEMEKQGAEFKDCLLISEHEVYGVLNGAEGVELEVLPAVAEEE